MVQILGKDVGVTGFGLMGFTWRNPPIEPEVAYDAMKAALNAGCTNWNGGDFYGTADYNSLHLLAGYFTKYPEDASRVVLSIKSGLRPDFSLDGSVEYVRDRVNNAVKILDGKKKIDIWEYARVPTNVDYFEVTLPELQKCVDEGLIGSIGLSEVSAETIRKAVKVVKISAVEVELSPWSTDILTNGIAEACGDNGIPIIAYSPMGRGMLTGQIKSPDDIPKGDFRHSIPRFFPENFHLNMKLVHSLEEVAKKQDCTPAQLALAWTRQAGQSLKSKPEILPIPGAVTVWRVLENSNAVKLSQEAMDEINKILQEVEVVGGRYDDNHHING